MIISQVHLSNIRSYVDERVFFKEGINFLKGDIGSGKSSILQSIEFALFGFKRGDLEGFHLLRKGSEIGFVELFLQSDNLGEIRIKRIIKRTKRGIVQDNGELEIEGNLEILSPTEISARVFDLLSYPKEFLFKNKNLLFRFSSYTPQDQLKEILFANNDDRLEIIRKLFSIDKYRQLEEGLSLYLKKKKSEMDLLNGRIKQLEEDILRKEEILRNLKLKEVEFEKKQKELDPISKELEKLKEDKKKCEDFINSLSEKEIRLNKNKNLIIRFEDSLKDLRIRENELNSFFRDNSNLDSSSFDKLNMDLKLKESSFVKLKLKRDSLLKKNDLLIEKRAILERNKNFFNSIDSEIKDLDSRFLIIKRERILISCRINDKRNKLSSLKRALKRIEKNNHIIKEGNINDLFERLGSLKSSKENYSLQLDSILNKNQCFSCNSDLSCLENHKDLVDELKSKISDLDFEIVNIKDRIKIFNESKFNEEKNLELKKETEINIKNLKFEIEELENKRKSLSLDISALEDSLLEKNKKKDFYLEEIQTIENYLNKNSKIADDLLDVEREIENMASSINDLKLKISEINSFKESFVNKKLELKRIKEKIDKLEKNISKKDLILEKEKRLRDLKSEKFKEKKKLDLRIEELYNLHSRVFGSLNAIKQDLKHLKSDLDRILDLEKKLQNVKGDLRNLEFIKSNIENKIIPSCSEIEKTIFLSFYVEFLEIFKKISKDLIEDQNIDVYLREDFSIFIEQNGYDVDLSNLSGGEKSSVAIAYRLALKEIIFNNLSSNNLLDTLILDEPTDGFSNQQVNKLGEILRSFNFKQIILVSHDEKIENIADHCLFIEKKNHVSNLIS